MKKATQYGVMSKHGRESKVKSKKKKKKIIIIINNNHFLFLSFCIDIVNDFKWHSSILDIFPFIYFFFSVYWFFGSPFVILLGSFVFFFVACSCPLVHVDAEADHWLSLVGGGDHLWMTCPIRRRDTTGVADRNGPRLRTDQPQSECARQPWWRNRFVSQDDDINDCNDDGQRKMTTTTGRITHKENNTTRL